MEAQPHRPASNARQVFGTVPMQVGFGAVASHGHAGLTVKRCNDFACFIKDLDAELSIRDIGVYKEVAAIKCNRARGQHSAVRVGECGPGATNESRPDYSPHTSLILGRFTLSTVSPRQMVKRLSITLSYATASKL
ncbi:MAG: hypothetical protein JWO89_2002 [Verrucomicrobiaceae bacterium]|nr:hypothetical protein [Verrucomicrobiaceae bacterium]